MKQIKSEKVLPVIVLSQFACTSLWFAGNAILPDLQEAFHVQDGAIGHITSAVNFGFISGTLVFALLAVSDRFSPSRVFFICAVAGALSNIAILYLADGFLSLLLLRIVTGFLLAGIYPVGMKIASDYYERGIGKALGFLVGALVIGTAFPHLVKALTQSLPWKYVIVSTSCCAAAGGLLIELRVPDGPYRKKNDRLDLLGFFRVFKVRDLRLAAFGYFGHMWELYAFWAFVPSILFTYKNLNPESGAFNIPLLSFLIIAVGGLGCVLGGHFSQHFGSSKTAFVALLSSGICCLISPFLFQLPVNVFFLIIFFWGMMVVADSPQFSALVAQFAPKESTGTALTMVNCIGFSITIISIQMINLMAGWMNEKYIYLILAAGPLLGLIAMSGLLINKGTQRINS